jgi:hypothetical protein
MHSKDGSALVIGSSQDFCDMDRALRLAPAVKPAIDIGMQPPSQDTTSGAAGFNIGDLRSSIAVRSRCRLKHAAESGYLVE